jgi:cytochrome b561
MAVFIALIALHVAAAGKHAFVNRDGIVKRMWFQRDSAG